MFSPASAYKTLDPVKLNALAHPNTDIIIPIPIILPAELPNNSVATANPGDCEFAGVDASLTHAEAAVIRYSISGKRTFFTGRADYLNNVLRLRDPIRALRQGKADSLLNKLSLFVHAAAISCSGTGNDLIDQRFLRLVIQLAFISKRSRSLHNFMLQAD